MVMVFIHTWTVSRGLLSTGVLMGGFYWCLCLDNTDFCPASWWHKSCPSARCGLSHSGWKGSKAVESECCLGPSFCYMLLKLISGFKSPGFTHHLSSLASSHLFFFARHQVFPYWCPPAVFQGSSVSCRIRVIEERHQTFCSIIHFAIEY